ncbi:MAG: alpha/beta fold hydrolase [Candidatus Dormibacteraeota bacterium]|nr:alpha/beta fold hydrolase [Candidatus Dormibacteraeota bacterium]
MTALSAIEPAPASTIADAADAAALLEAREIVTGFGSHAVLHGVSLSVAHGEIAGIFGLNGAGKSVTIKVLSGLVPAWSGSVRIDGVDITRASAEARVARGIGNVPQGRQVFSELTVEQNLRLGAYQLRRHHRERYQPVLEHVYDRFPVLASRRTQIAGTMSGGEQASLAVARALMSEPKLLLIDEPSAGLAPKVVEELFQTLAALNRDGLTILLVEQNVTFGLQLVHTAHLMRSGRVVYSGASSELDRERVAGELGIGRLLSRTTAVRPAAAPREGAKSRKFSLSSGSIAAELSGSPEGRLVIGLPGLSGNLRSFDVIFEHLDSARYRKLAFDPRGRGRSAKTRAGTYGWPNDARDVIDMADELGQHTFDLVGWSMGTWIAMTACQLAPGRVRRIALIDGGGVPEDSALVPIHAGLERLGTVYPSRDAFMQLVRATGLYEPWDVWERYFDYELETLNDGGVRPSTRADACWEDENYRKANFTYDLWDTVTMPSLLLRARRPIPPEHGYILTQADTESFQRTVKGSRTAEVDAHHYSVGMHVDTARAIAAFLDRE